MSGPGQGYYYGQGQPAHGSASSLFGSTDNQQQDPFGSVQHPNQSPYQQHDHGMNTVYEEDEPAPSPETGRHDQHWGAQGGAYDQQQNQQQQYDVPSYPGWIYNPATNSYDPDPSFQADGGDASAGGAGQDSSAGGADQGAYGAYDQQGEAQQQGFDYGAQYGQNGGDDYYGAFEQNGAQQGQADPYAAYGQQGQDAQGQAAADQQVEQDQGYSAGDQGQTGSEQQQQWDAPVYPGWVWNAATGQYDPEPEQQLEPEPEPEPEPAPAPQQSYAPPPAAAQQNPYAPAPQQQQQQQASYDPYAPTNNRASSFSPPPEQAPRDNAYSPPPAQQQYTSFAAAFNQPQQQAPQQQQSAPYDPYAPVPKQQRGRSDTATSSYDPYAPAQQQQRQRSDTQTSSFDPYGSQGSAQGYSAPAAKPYDPYAASAQATPASPPTHYAPLPRTAQQQNALQGLASPPPVTRSAFSPPPRSSSAASSASAHPQQQQQQQAAQGGRQGLAAPPRTSSVASGREQPAQAAPPPKAAAPPPRATGAAPPPRGGAGAAPPRQQAPPSSGAAFDIPPPRQAPAARRAHPAQSPPQQTQQLPPAQQAPPPPAAPPTIAFEPEPEYDEEPTPEPEPAPAPSAYAPAPAAPSRDVYSAPSQPVLPPSQRKQGATLGVMQPPARRAPHQRGASAFAGDSPYGALPSGPPTSMYEPPQTVDQIKEEEEEEEAVPQKQEEVEPEDVVPSWMQQAAAPPAAAPFFPPKTAKPEPPAPADDLAAGMQKMSIQEPPSKQGPPPRGGQGPPPPRQAPPPAGAPPPRTAGGPPPPRAQPPPAAAAPPRGAPPPARGGPPPRAQPPQQPSQQRPPPPQQQQPPRFQPPPPAQPHGCPPVQVPASPDRAKVPQLQFEAPSPGDRSRAQNGYYGREGVPMSGIEETPEEFEQEDEQGDYFGGASQPQQAGQEYGMDDSTVFSGEASQAGGDASGTGVTTPSSAYGGDWKADSENTQGYDYISREHTSQPKPYDPYAPGQPSQPRDAYAPPPAAAAPKKAPHDPYAPSSAAAPPAPRDPYAPRDVPSRESAFTPPAQQQRGVPPAAHASPSSRSRFGEPGAKPPVSPSAAMARANSYGAAASPSRGPDSYAAYPAQPPAGPYATQASGNLTAPAAYGSFAQAGQQQQQKPYDPYAAQPKAPALSRQASFAGESADLGLERRTAPVVSFGFGGRMLLVFPSNGQPAYSVDSANPYGAQAAQASSGSPTTVHVRKLADVVSAPASEGAAAWPGPIFLDGGKANAGKKRKEAVAWLSQRIGELDAEVKAAGGAVPPGFGDEAERKTRKRETETRLLLFKLVLVLVENEGKLIGIPKVDDAVRAIFASDSLPSAESDTALPTADQLASAAASQPTTGSQEPFVTYGVSPAHLDTMSSFLLRGERREAVRFALDNKIWAHAFIIASCVDTDCWKDVTVEFLRSELTPNPENGDGAQGREALRVAYSMFAGLGAESIDQFVPPRALGPQSGLLPAAPIGNGLASAPLSRTATGSSPQQLSEATLEKWQDTVGMIVANRTAGDSAALTALGDALAANGWTGAAHICYLLSPQTSLAAGLGTPGSRIALVGSTPFLPDGGIDLESVKLTELVEFALSLTPTVKGHEPFAGFPHLQAYRLYHAAVLADQGHVPQALKYTEAVVNTLKLATKPSPFYHPRLVAQIKALSERLGSAPGQEKSGSWIARKVPRPTVNSLWSTFEGGFNKFISGDEEPSAQQLAAKAEVAKTTNGAPVGPFSHYSSISPGSTSGTLSRAQSTTDLASSNLLHANAIPPRPLSAAGPTSPLATNPPVQPPLHSPGPPPVKRAPYKGHHARSSSLGAFAGYEYNANAAPSWHRDPPKVADTLTASPGKVDSSEPAPRRPHFAAVEDDFKEDASGFISPMGQYTPSVSPAPAAARNAAQQAQTHRRMTTAEELADLGIGNSKSKKPAFDTLDEELEAEEGGMTPTERKPAQELNGPAPGPSAGPAAAAAAAASAKGDDGKPALKPSASKGWLGGWFKREASPAEQGPGPVKAKLGEKQSLVYDKELRRWVNKNGTPAGDETPAVTPPPRAATASPSRGYRNLPPRSATATPPVPPLPSRAATNPPPPLSRSATSADLRSQGGGPPPMTTGPPRSGAATPSEGGMRAPARKKKAAHAHLPQI